MTYRDKIEQITGKTIAKLSSLSGGMIGDVYRVDLTDGQTLVAKVMSGHNATLDIEGKMLQYLSDHSDLPIPQVIHSETTLLLMSYIDNQGRLSASVQESAAHHLATLHNVTSDQFGLSFDTLIGGLHQPNQPMDSWIDFFREQRLRYMAQVAYDAEQLPLSTRQRIDQFALELENWLYEPEQPSLIHGDMWGGNVLAHNNQIAGFVDPALYYAHAEIELAFSTLFGTFGDAFFSVYQTLRPIEAGFFETRRDVYNLYPLLVHVRLFGGGYVSQVENTLKRFGY